MTTDTDAWLRAHPEIVDAMEEQLAKEIQLWGEHPSAKRLLAAVLPFIHAAVARECADFLVKRSGGIAAVCEQIDASVLAKSIAGARVNFWKEAADAIRARFVR